MDSTRSTFARDSPDATAATVFKPQPDQEIALFGESFFFRSFERGTFRMVHASDVGGRATIYKLRSLTGQDWALKVFRPGCRSPELAHIARRLEPLYQLDGLRAANRRVILPSDPATRLWDQLSYAMLMPWIGGQTWNEILEAATEGKHLEAPAAIHLCAHFLDVVCSIEGLCATHTDIAGGNVVIELAARKIQVIDLEDVYFPGTPPGDSRGTPGYTHPRDNRVACREGDRYAAAILAAEILLLANPPLAAMTGESGFFGDDHGSQEAGERFREAERWLRGFAPTFWDVFRQTWRSASLATCPPIGLLRASLGDLVARIPAADSWNLVRSHIRSLKPAPPPPTPKTGAATRTTPAPLHPPPALSPVAPAQPRVGAGPSGFTVLVWTFLVLAAIVILLILLKS